MWSSLGQCKRPGRVGATSSSYSAVQLVGAAALLGIHVDGVAQLGDHYALFESAVGPL